MRIRSHLDTTLFVMFLHVDASRYDREFVDLARTLTPKAQTNVQPLFAMLRGRERRIFRHEQYHFWQGLRLPFLHFYAMLTFRSVWIASLQMARITPDWTQWPAIEKSDAGFFRIDMQSVISGDPEAGHLTFGARAHGDMPMHVACSPKEMLECAASIFDFQGSCEKISEAHDVEVFRRWRKLTPASMSLFDFYATFIGDEGLALRSIMPLINAAMHTSIPERALAELIGGMWANFSEPNEEARELVRNPSPHVWKKLFHHFLSGLTYDHPYGEVPPTLNLAENKFYFMPAKLFLDGKFGGGVGHPILGPPAAEWAEKARENPAYEDYIDGPAFITDGEVFEWTYAMQPQLRIIRLFMEDGRDRVFSVGDGAIGDAFHAPAFAGTTASQFRGLLLDTMALYGTFRRATDVNFTVASRTCYHEACPHFADNFCNAYPIIPDDFVECGFPDRLREWIENANNMENGT